MGFDPLTDVEFEDDSKCHFDKSSKKTPCFMNESNPAPIIIEKRITINAVSLSIEKTSGISITI